MNDGSPRHSNDAHGPSRRHRSGDRRAQVRSWLGLAVISAVGAGWVLAPQVAQRADAVGPKRDGTAVIGDAVTLTNGLRVETRVSGAAAAQASAALARVKLRLDVDRAAGGWTVVFLPSRKGALGMTLVPEKRVEIYLRSGRGVTATAHDLAHELGHVIDVTSNDDEARIRYLALRSLPASTPWWTCDACRDTQVGAGDFAEIVAQIAVPGSHFYSELAALPDAATLAVLGSVLPEGVLTRSVDAAREPSRSASLAGSRPSGSGG